MSVSINEVTPVEKENSTGTKIPCSYTTLAETVYFRDGESLKHKWETEITNAPVFSKQTGKYNTTLQWDVLRYGYNYAVARVHGSGFTAAELVTSTNDLTSYNFAGLTKYSKNASLVDNAILIYYIECPEIKVPRENKTTDIYKFRPYIPSFVTAGDNGEVYQDNNIFTIQSSVCLKDDGCTYVRITVKLPIEFLANYMHHTSVDFNIEIAGEISK